MDQDPPTTEPMVLLYVPCGSAAEAGTLARALLDARLIACANLHSIRSLYHWQGEIVDEAEVVLLAKTTPARAPAAESLIAAQHSYSVPAILRLPVTQVNAPYLTWLTEQVTGDR